MNSMHVKKGDTVTVVTGKDKGKTGKIVRSLPTRQLVIVEGLNLKKRRVKARTNKDAGQTVQMSAPIHVSNVKLATKAVKTAKKTTKTAKK
ncbi:MAG: large subunit ribosomal protein [Patescibacteria group bacterium]|nr:large subunit ribosomal protein [Patescibacteria group bacterium]